MTAKQPPEPLKCGETVEVPNDIAVCPECGGKLLVTSNANYVESGRPIAGDLQIDCEREDYYDPSTDHRWWQGEWQPVIDVIRVWVGAESEFDPIAMGM